MSITQSVINKYRPRADVFIETGTYLGDACVMAHVAGFTKIFTIEVDEALAARAGDRFKDLPHIVVNWGDSATHLRHVLQIVDRPALFWLDGHWSQGVTGKGLFEVPIMQELAAIKYSPIKTHTIMIDDICVGA